MCWHTEVKIRRFLDMCGIKLPFPKQPRYNANTLLFLMFYRASLLINILRSMGYCKINAVICGAQSYNLHPMPLNRL